MHYQGKMYRPWPEANSLLIQATLGCSNNYCTFCTMFDDKTFKIRPLEGVFADIEEARRLYPHVESIFLTDGNVLVVNTEHLLKILHKIRETFPELKRIAVYAGLNDLRRKSVEDLIRLKQAGISLVYSGLESGDPVTLKRIKKRLTPEQVVAGMEHAKQAGLEVLLSFIFGLGGHERSHEHIVATTNLLNQVQPEQIAPMALTIQPGSELEAEIERGEFIQPTPLQILEEEKYLLENLDFETYYWGDHGNNIRPMRGPLPLAQFQFLESVKESIRSNPVVKDRILATMAW